MASMFPRILYFIAGMSPTPEDLEAADKYGPGVKFRNATLIAPEGPIESADGVAGAIPKNYADALPHADDRDAVRERVMARNPNLANYAGASSVPKAESDEAKASRIANDLSRGAKPAPVNERKSYDPSLPSGRVTQSGHPSVVTGEQPPSSGWGTDPGTLNADDAETGDDGSDAANGGQPAQANDGFTTQRPAAPVGNPKPLTAAQRKAAKKAAAKAK